MIIPGIKHHPFIFSGITCKKLILRRKPTIFIWNSNQDVTVLQGDLDRHQRTFGSVQAQILAISKNRYIQKISSNLSIKDPKYIKHLSYLFLCHLTQIQTFYKHRIVPNYIITSLLMLIMSHRRYQVIIANYPRYSTIII